MSLSVSGGVGLHVEAHITEYARVDSGGYWVGKHWGINDGYLYSSEDESQGIPVLFGFVMESIVEWPVYPMRDEAWVAARVIEEDDDFLGVCLPGACYFYGPIFSFPADAYSFPNIESTEMFHVGADVNIGCIGMEAGVDLRQLADFLLGFFWIDICDDDHTQPTPAPAAPELDDSGSPETPAPGEP